MLLALPVLVFAGEPIATLVNPDEKFHEEIVDEVAVSGQVVAGVGVGNAGGQTAAKQFAVLMPARQQAQPICVQVFTRDGHYWSRNNFKVPAVGASAFVPLQYSSQHLDELHALNRDDLAVLAYPGQCQRAIVLRLLVADWRPVQAGAPDKLQVYVNSSRADTYVRVRGDTGRPKRCRPIKQGRRTIYDTVCEISVSQPNAAELEFEILRRRYDRAMPPVRYSVILAGNDGGE